MQFQEFPPVLPPAARQMVRYFQAYNAVEDGVKNHIVQRRLSVSQPVVQIRLSILLATGCSFLIVLAATARAKLREPRDPFGRKLRLPSSRLDWMVQAAPGESTTLQQNPTSSFIKQHKDLVYVSSLTYEPMIRWPMSHSTPQRPFREQAVIQ